MTTLPKSEPKSKKAKCAYCGDAPVPHELFYFESLISGVLDPHIKKVARRAPQFLRSFADWLPTFVFRAFVFLRLGRFSSDIEKAKTFRSKVIWEEARHRGIPMEQLIFLGKPLDYYRARVNDANIFFESIPLPNDTLDMKDNWDDKFILKRELAKKNIPAPMYALIDSGSHLKLAETFSKFTKPVIVKPKVGSRGRHTLTNIHNFEDFKKAVKVAGALSPRLVIEEHLHGYVCRATLVQGKLLGFYRGEAPYVLGDGIRTIRELVEEKNKTRPERVEAINLGEELGAYIGRSGFKVDDVLGDGARLALSHRVGRLFGGRTREMLDELHPSFVPILESAARMLELSIVGFDVIVPDPERSEGEQRWGIIECNTLPFIDLHYYALEGRPKNIAGAIWDMWEA